MDYNLEVLGDERFQKLCQSLLISSFPNVQCLPVGQPDGGRDAFERHAGGFVVFQIKYSKSPQNKDERVAVSDVIRSERSKVELLIRKGATAFYLMTNVAGTAHPGNGSVDILNAELTETFGVPSFCWWRDDIERRIEATAGLIWRYPEIFRGSDFLEVLASGRAGHPGTPKASTFRAYVSYQYGKESKVRFQQVQIDNSLFDLFTDTPIGTAREKIPGPDTCNVQEGLLARIDSTTRNQRYRHFHDDASEDLAAEWLLTVAPEKGLQRIVLEGAPGQGKSTVTQYIAQLHRMRSLRKDVEFGRVPARHLTQTLRLPLRVDLRDYAAWLTGNDPFATEKDIKRPPQSLDGIESFLSHQIHSLSGGREFKVDDLTTMLHGSHSLLILDGFDEVADKATRVRLIEQIRTGTERIGEDCCSLQVIVTSRPAAFILSPGFQEREWLHLSLLPMRIDQIAGYTDKWIAARGLSSAEGRAHKELLLDRVSRSHIRSLAQNPMQLAILLSLINTKGLSLPDKRTALYDSYIDLFFGREAEKDATVRENRDVLLQIQQYVAWILQLDAEKAGGSGSISQTDLEALVKGFLLEKEHDGDVLKLFTGAVERVGALISRVQGMLEFEVQPLREYFAGRFLYVTAPYSPPGAEKGGTRPERFDALARRPYWLNVARFYAGCYNSGELSSLVSGIEQLEEGASLALRSHLLQLAILFLNDHVFAQEPRTVRDLIDFLSEKRNLKLLIASRSTWEDDRLILPEKSGRKEFCAKVQETFVAASETGELARLGQILRLNLEMKERWEIWEQCRLTVGHALFKASCLGLFHDAEGQQLQELIDVYGDDARQAFVSFGRWDALSPDDRVAAVNATATRLNPASVLHRHGRLYTSDRDLYRVHAMLNPTSFEILNYRREESWPFEDALMHFGILQPSIRTELSIGAAEATLFDVMTAANRVSQLPLNEWRTSLKPWSDFIESVRRTWGDGPRSFCLAAISAGVISRNSRASAFGGVLDKSLPLAERARYARLKTSMGWWQDALANATDQDQKMWVLTLLLSWGSAGILMSVLPALEHLLDDLDEASWMVLIQLVRTVVASTRSVRQPVSISDEDRVMASSSVRLKALLTLRTKRTFSLRILTDVVERYDGGDKPLGVLLANQTLREAQKDGKLWKTVVHFFSRHEFSPVGSGANYVLNQDRFYYMHEDNIPSALAQQISEDYSNLPLSILELTESNLSRRANPTSETLGEISTKRAWFSVHNSYR